MHMAEQGCKQTCNDSGVAWVILGDVLLHLANKVGSHVSSLGVDAAPNTAEQGNGRASQTVAGNGLVHTLVVVSVELQHTLVGDDRPQKQADSGLLAGAGSRGHTQPSGSRAVIQVFTAAECSCQPGHGQTVG